MTEDKRMEAVRRAVINTAHSFDHATTQAREFLAMLDAARRCEEEQRSEVVPVMQLSADHRILSPEAIAAIEARAREAERESVVAWLRDCVAACKQEADGPYVLSDQKIRMSYISLANELDHKADRIQMGEHLKARQP